MIAGVDGCRGGWYVVKADPTSGTISGSVYSSFGALLSEATEKSIIAIDIPIGLVSAGARSCDLAARRLLGPRASSVFPAPIRPVLEASTHASASATRRSVEGKGMSIQSFAITGKIREVDLVLQSTPQVAGRVVEVHPEVSFAAINGDHPLLHSKKRAAGRGERLALLSAWFGDAPGQLVAGRPKSVVEADDVLDAFAALWSAHRVATGTSKSLPDERPIDEAGLPMAIFY